MTSGKTTVVHVFGAMDRGGAEMRTLELIQRLDPTRVRSLFVTLSGRPGSLAKDFQDAGAEVLPLRLSSRFPLAFFRLLRAERVDAVHSHVATFSGALLLLARTAKVTRRIAHFRSDSPPDRPRLPKRIQYRVMRALINWNATDIVGVSPGSLTRGWRANWESDSRCRVLPSGIDLVRFATAAPTRELRTLVGGKKADKIVLHVGRGVPLKNRERAISIFAVLARQRPGLRLAFVGADNLEDRARWNQSAENLGIADRVTFLGERDDVPQLLKAADLLLFTSYYEGLPGVVVEAAAAGTPVVASDLPGVSFVAMRVRDIQPVSLEESDETWASHASGFLDRDLTLASRESAHLRLVGGIFDLARALPTFLALWNGDGTKRLRP